PSSQGATCGVSHPWGHRPTRRCHRRGPTRLRTWRFTKPLLRKHAPHCGQRGHDVGRRARSASTDSTRWMARTRANDHAARISAGSVWASSTVQSKRCTEGSSSRMLSLRHSIGHRSPFGTRLGGSKSVPYVCCYASPPPTVNYARSSFFILTYLKTSALQVMQGRLFGMGQAIG